MRIKRKKLFFIMRIIGLFITGMIVALVVALSQVNLETLRGNLLQILRDSTGLPVEIDGAVSWKFSLQPRIQLNQVHVLNADWAKNKYAFSADRIVVRINLLSLLRDKVSIQSLRINNVAVHLEQNDKGQYSVERLASDKDISADTEQMLDSQKIPSEYPFEDLGLGAVRVRKLMADINGEIYNISEFSVRYVPKDTGREYAGWIRSDEEVFPFIVSFGKYNADRKIYPMQVALATGGDALIADVALEGSSMMPIDFKLRGEIPDMAAFGKLFNMDLSYVPTLKLNLAGGLDRKKFILRKSSVSLRNTDLNVSGIYDWSKKVPAITLDIQSKSIKLAQLLPEMFPDRPWVHPNRDLNVFQGIPLYGKELYGRNVTVHLVVDKFVAYRNLTLGKVDLRVKLDNNIGRVTGALNIAGGNVKTALDADIAPSGYMNVQMGFVGHNIVIGKLLGQLNYDDLITDLPVDIDAYLRASGSNMSELMQTVTGPVRLESVGAGYLHDLMVSYMYGADFLTNLRHSIQDLFRSDKKYNQMKISCVAINTKLRDGIAETKHGVAVETNAINLRLAGDVNLGKETMHLDLTTVPVRGLKLSLSGNVVNSMEITGNLAEPDIKISGTAVVGKVASATGLGLLLAPLTGGIGLVAGAGVGLLAGDLLENWLADDTPCKTAMQRGAPPRRDDPEWLNVPMDELLESVF